MTIGEIGIVKGESDRRKAVGSENNGVTGTATKESAYQLKTSATAGMASPRASLARGARGMDLAPAWMVERPGACELYSQTIAVTCGGTG